MRIQICVLASFQGFQTHRCIQRRGFPSTDISTVLRIFSPASTRREAISLLPARGNALPLLLNLAMLPERYDSVARQALRLKGFQRASDSRSRVTGSVAGSHILAVQLAVDSCKVMTRLWLTTPQPYRTVGVVPTRRTRRQPPRRCSAALI